MTTKNSPIKRLKAQADKIAEVLCAAERGDAVDVSFKQKLEAARDKDTVSVGIAMDDKIIKIDLPWSVIKTSGRAGLATYILDQMQEKRRTLQ